MSDITSNHKLHHSYLHTLAKLHGKDAPDVKTARVLEIGCKSGHRILSSALLYPLATFVGIDNSATDIDNANKSVRELELSNALFSDLSILDEMDDEYDYIICHMFILHNDEHMCNRVLKFIGSNLSRTGVSLVTYPVKPGWYHQQAAKDMLSYRYHVRSDVSSLENTAKLLNLSKSIGSTVTSAVADDELKRILGDKVSNLKDLSSSGAYYFHEIYSKFVENNLIHMCDWELTHNNFSVYGKAFNHLMSVRNYVEHEQYCDFLINRHVRGSLLINNSQNMIERSIGRNSIRQMYIMSFIRPNGTIKLGQTNGSFMVENMGITMELKGMNAVAIGLTLSQNKGKQIPAIQLYSDLCGKLLSNNYELNPNLESELWMTIVKLLQSKCIEVSTEPPLFATNISEKPCVSRWVLYCIKNDIGVNFINLRFRNISIDENIRKLVLLIDGTRSVAELVSLATTSEIDHEKALRLISELLKKLAQSALLIK